MPNQVRAHAIISGRVQGVFFRAETQRAATGHKVTGWVRNLPDKSVEAVLEGEQAAVESVLEWCRQGPPYARVDNVVVRWEAYTGAFKGFEIAY